MKTQHFIYSLFILIGIITLRPLQAQDASALIGKWDLEVEKEGKIYPSWLEVKLSLQAWYQPHP